MISYIIFFLIGMLLANGMPHFIWGVSGTIARSPFGERSKPQVNIRWGLANFAAATLLVWWQIVSYSFSIGALISLLIGFWITVGMFGFGIKRFVHNR